MPRSLEFYMKSLSFIEFSIEFGIKSLVQRHLGSQTSHSCSRTWLTDCDCHQYQALKDTLKQHLKAGPWAGENNSTANPFLKKGCVYF